jgi:hypothetical protein
MGAWALFELGPEDWLPSFLLRPSLYLRHWPQEDSIERRRSRNALIHRLGNMLDGVARDGRGVVETFR